MSRQNQNQNQPPTPFAGSPFHIGEQAIQSRMGVRDQMERFGSKVIRDHMPEQHRQFYTQLPFLLMGHCDIEGWPWASIVTAPSKFVVSPDERHLEIYAQPITGDPLAESLTAGLAVGVLGIQADTRRRNRLSTVVDRIDREPDQGMFVLKVKQSFGNCPQYIQSRDTEVMALNSSPAAEAIHFTSLSDEAVALIESSDTFYVASSTGVTATESNASYGADVSHRGGKPGFVDVDEAGLLTIPDYLGNNHFNTLGNFDVYPRAGLLFIDEETQSVLMLTGSVEIIWNHELQHHFEGAQRFWQFRLKHGVWLKSSLPLKTTMKDYSANTLLTGDWQSARKLKEAEHQKNQWQACRVTRKVKESNAISSFYLEPESAIVPKFLAGQFITLQLVVDGRMLVRSYTVSRTPGFNEYRISVKRDDQGQVSRFLHDSVAVGARLLMKSPQGLFTFDTTAAGPAVMLTAGIGITPAVSMLQNVIRDGIRRRYIRSVLLIATVRSDKDRAFARELEALENESGGKIRIFWAMTSPEKHLEPGVDYQHGERISADLLQSLLPVGDNEFYLCGPDGFMQSTYDMLLQLGMSDRRIKAESFGPSSLKRQFDATEESVGENIAATQALVIFKNANGEVLAEQQWTDDAGSLLELAEAHGLQPTFGCRSGSCGSCVAKLSEGSTMYQQQTIAVVPDGSVLLCCAKPKARVDGAIPTIDIELSS